MLVNLTAIFFSNIIEIEINRLAANAKFSSGVTVPVVFHCDGWATTVSIVFVATGGVLRASPVETKWSMAPNFLAALLTCLVNLGKWMRSTLTSMSKLLCLMKCKPIFGPVKFFITTECFAEVLSPLSNLSVARANGFFNWPFTTCNQKSVR